MNSQVVDIEPVALLMAVDQTSVWNLLLTPADDVGTYVLTVSVVME
ncbi:hypothetical protein [Synoicihabitans lomoniglobus]|uniref:Uncharacterized protein n=1 Tax=Synoicihabitans lomoniglobus TaxID=2909285 RepID=A0AAF0CQI6_9BACT|nr:hypothetical protein [Opitutaceae bacterium LMO-M01]WED66221.1 hypothetical protein PXH66_05095 [Opitutaceae bacterium LMO-M01]